MSQVADDGLVLDAELFQSGCRVLAAISTLNHLRQTFERISCEEGRDFDIQIASSLSDNLNTLASERLQSMQDRLDRFSTIRSLREVLGDDQDDCRLALEAVADLPDPDGPSR